jgi:hypothetical protein
MQPSSPESSQPRKRRRVENPVSRLVDVEAAEDDEGEEEEEEDDEGEEDLTDEEDEDDVGMYQRVLIPDETWLN